MEIVNGLNAALKVEIKSFYGCSHKGILGGSALQSEDCTMIFGTFTIFEKWDR